MKKFIRFKNLRTLAERKTAAKKMTDEEFQYHVCEENKRIKVSTFPGSHRLAEIEVCDKCKDFYLLTDLDASQPLENEFMRTDEKPIETRQTF